MWTNEWFGTSVTQTTAWSPADKIFQIELDNQSRWLKYSKTVHYRPDQHHMQAQVMKGKSFPIIYPCLLNEFAWPERNKQIQIKNQKITEINYFVIQKRFNQQSALKSEFRSIMKWSSWTEAIVHINNNVLLMYFKITSWEAMWLLMAMHYYLCWTSVQALLK